MRNKFFYSYSIKMCASGFDELLAFSASCWLWKQPAKSWVASRSGSCLARGKVNVVDEAKLLSPVCSTFEALVVQRVFRHCSRELGPFCWPILATDVVVFGASHRLTENSSQMWWFHQDSESCVGKKKRKLCGSDREQTTTQWPWPFLVQVWLWEVLECF